LITLGEFVLGQPERPAQRFRARHAAHPVHVLLGERLRVGIPKRRGMDHFVRHRVDAGPIMFPGFLHPIQSRLPAWTTDYP